jgi:surfeit locus 1 family protein
MTSSPDPTARRFPVGLTIAVAIAFAILVGLGTWQLQRMAWKEGLLARIAALQAAEAVPAEPVLARVAAGADADFTRVTVRCPDPLGAAPFLELYGLHDGRAGVRLVSVCTVAAGPYRSLLVDRGFVPDTVPFRPPFGGTGSASGPPPAEITGILRRPDHGNRFSPANTPKLWYTRDVPAMAAALKAPAPAPLFLMAETSSNPGWSELTPAPIPADIPNNHFTYALTWYGLAAALLGVYAAMLFRRRTP